MKQGIEGRRTGIFGGTFDPVHKAHLLVADAVRKSADLDRVIFIPSARPPHKSPDDIMFSAGERLRMLELALAEHPRMVVSDLELRREGPSYTIDTLREMRRERGPGDDLFFIIGSDNLTEISSWREPLSIVRECTIIAVKRPGVPDDVTPGWLRGHVMEVDAPFVDISSTAIRQRIRSGDCIRGLIPESVREFIEQARG